MPDKVLFLTLKVFSATGGIEKVCRVAGKALFENTLQGSAQFLLYSLHDKQEDAGENRYFPAEHFKGFGGGRFSFIWNSFRKARRCNIVLLSHINLLPVGWIIKLFFPGVKLILYAHGIEVWATPGSWTRRMMQSVDVILPVSAFTRDRLQELNDIAPERCKILNNCLDPFLPLPHSIRGVDELRRRYGFNAGDRIVFTLTRVSSKERYKGYDKVLESIAFLKKEFPAIKYVLAGSYDKEEKAYVDSLVCKLGLRENVIMSGFIPEEEVAAHFLMSDIYVMPSLKEGFGLVFIEAMFYGLPVVAGNKDGSVDALDNGNLGLLANPFKVESIISSIYEGLSHRNMYIPDHEYLLRKFGYAAYKTKLSNILFDRATAPRVC